MTRINIVVEGQTEETFIKEILGPALHPRGVFPYACLIGRPSHKGGRVTYERVVKDVVLFLKQDRRAFCSTLLDLYGLGRGFPGTPLPAHLTGLEKATRIEQAVKADLVAQLPQDLRADARFLPHFQPYEYEGLLFSDPVAFANGIYSPNLVPVFQGIRDQFTTPEDINDGPETAPSKRVLHACPQYRKPLYGALAAMTIGIGTMRRECRHFNNWVERLESLATFGA